jgi:hypothetical protein
LAIRCQRKARNLSQKELGSKLKTSQPRIVKIERAAADASLDQFVRAFTTAGGKMVVKSVTSNSPEGQAGKRPSGHEVERFPHALPTRLVQNVHNQEPLPQDTNGAESSTGALAADLSRDATRADVGPPA